MKKKILTVIVLMIVTSFSFCSCGSNSEEPMSACIVYSNRANCTAPNFTNSTLKSITNEVAKTFGAITAICIDGEPEVVGSVSYDDIPDNVKKAGSDKIKKDALARIDSFTSTISTCIANNSEADLLESLRLAVRSLSSNIQTTNKTIIVMDSGLSTTGLLNFNNNLLNADAEKIAEELNDKKAIPDFTDCEVIFLNMGDVCAPQEELSPQQVNHLAEIWQTIVEKGDGKFTLAGSMPSTDQTKDEFPSVTPIDVPEEQPISYTGTDFDMNNPMMIDEEQIQFVGDSDKFVDEQKATETITPIADYLKKHEEVSILLVGTTAGDLNSEYTLSLSQTRADAVRNRLISLGIPKSRIKSIGLGCGDPWHIDGVGTEGSLASQNRKVVVLDAKSGLAKELC